MWPDYPATQPGRIAFGRPHPHPLQKFARDCSRFIQLSIHLSVCLLAGYLEFSGEFLDVAEESKRIDLLKR